MSHYNVNGSVPKTLIQYLVRWVVETRQVDPEAAATLLAVLEHGDLAGTRPCGGAPATCRARRRKSGRTSCRTFNLFYITRYGLRPSKVAFLALRAWGNASRGAWPPNFPDEAKHAYTLADIKHWLGIFLYRFFEISQYKRSALPNGPKVLTGGSLSPRGDWRAPSDGNATLWLEELERNVPGEP